jgi:hypothetical protein
MVNQPAKKNYLSGDACAFNSDGKELCRAMWWGYSIRKHYKENRLLEYLWLANNQLTDIKPLFDTGKFTIPDTNASNRAAKRKTLVNNFGMKKRNTKIAVLNNFDAVISGDIIFDVINFDSCSHLDEETLINIDNILQFNTSHSAYLFATFTQSSMRSVLQNRFPEYKRITGDKTEISNVMKIVFNRNSYNSKELKGFPLTYESGNKQNLHSFGWELNRA